MTNLITEPSIKKSFAKALKAIRLPRRGHVIGTVVELRALDGSNHHILTSVQSVRWSPGAPLRLFVAAAESGECAAVLRELIPYRAGLGRGVRAYFADDTDEPRTDFLFITH